MRRQGRRGGRHGAAAAGPTSAEGMRGGGGVRGKTVTAMVTVRWPAAGGRSIMRLMVRTSVPVAGTGIVWKVR